MSPSDVDRNALRQLAKDVGLERAFELDQATFARAHNMAQGFASRRQAITDTSGEPAHVFTFHPRDSADQKDDIGRQEDETS